MLNFKKIITVFMLTGVLAACQTAQVKKDNASENNNSDQSDQLSMNDDTPLRPKSDIAKINAELGIAYLEHKNVQRAKQKLLMALEQGPNIPEPWYSMGYFMEATGNREEANKYYLKSVQIAPARGDAQNNYGTFLCRSGHYQESIKHFMLAVNSPSYLDPAAAYENAGLCSMKMGSYKQAAGYFNQALLKDPARTTSLLKLAETNAKLGNFKLAGETLRQYELVAEPTHESEKLKAQISRHQA